MPYTADGSPEGHSLEDAAPFTNLSKRYVEFMFMSGYHMDMAVVIPWIENYIHARAFV